ncbi:hypothetical protein CRENBAI_000976 [Crenichthys baileyi]|uniref:Uncharacterized protein n=1 Tax=Crenichthys baileyi TaxID=28760 RepID=A0AAV9SNC6_9TELE
MLHRWYSNQPPEPGGGPLPSGGGDRKTQHMSLGCASLGWCLKLRDPGPARTPTPRPGPRPQRPPSSSGEGVMATLNQDTDIEHMPPNPNAMNPLPTAQGQTPTGELHTRKANEATPTQCQLHIQPCYKQPHHILPPPHCAPLWQDKGPS